MGSTAGSRSGASALAVAVTSWGLAEYFTRQRRMALPSIVLLLAFVGGVFEAPDPAAAVRAYRRAFDPLPNE